MRAGVRVFRVGADVLLDQRRERGFAEVAVAVEPGVDEQVQVVRRAARLVEAGLRRRHRYAQRAVPVSATRRG